MSTFVLPLPQGSFQSSFEKHWAEDVTLCRSTLNIKRTTSIHRTILGRTNRLQQINVRKRWITQFQSGIAKLIYVIFVCYKMIGIEIFPPWVTGKKLRYQVFVFRVSGWKKHGINSETFRFPPQEWSGFFSCSFYKMCDVHSLFLTIKINFGNAFSGFVRVGVWEGLTSFALPGWINSGRIFLGDY